MMKISAFRLAISLAIFSSSLNAEARGGGGIDVESIGKSRLCYAYNKTPCEGAKGKCSTNSDGSAGGFVADSAYVEKLPNRFFWIKKKNRPYISPSVQVCGSSSVTEDARLDDYTQVRDSAKIYGNAKVSNSIVQGDSRVYGESVVEKESDLSGDVEIFEKAAIQNSKIYGGKIHGNSEVQWSIVRGESEIFGKAHVLATNVADCMIYDNAKIFSSIEIDFLHSGYGSISNSRIYGHAKVSIRGGEEFNDELRGFELSKGAIKAFFYKERKEIKVLSDVELEKEEEQDREARKCFSHFHPSDD